MKYTLLGLVFAGAVGGMIIMGTLGDLIGPLSYLSVYILRLVEVVLQGGQRL